METVERLSAPAPGLIFPGKVSCGQPVAAPVERWKSTGISTPRWKTPGGKLRSLFKIQVREHSGTSYLFPLHSYLVPLTRW